NVLIGRDGKTLVAVIVDTYCEGEPQWDEDMYADSLADIIGESKDLGRGDAVVIVTLDDDRALLRHHYGLYPPDDSD
ncbi:MAG: hypothetical protein Q7U75_17660, partial [Desulfobacterales bacterium]|nr:hypothetical protein [Desulfobacterales bacterium]